MNYTRQLRVAQDAAEVVGNHIEQGFHNYHQERERFSLTRKVSRDSSSIDDVSAEDLLKKILLGEFPDYSWFGEETGRQGNSRYEWVIDPTDGTTLKALHIPYFSISNALYDRDIGKIVVGVVYNPITHEMFSAMRGEGAFYRNTKSGENHKLRASDNLDFKHMIATTNPNMDVPQTIPVAAKIWLALNNHFRIVPIFYSSALEMTKIADGLADALVCPRSAPYDHAAGSLLVEEAGGVVVSPDGRDFDPMKRGIVAVNRKETLEELKRAEIFNLLKELD